MGSASDWLNQVSNNAWPFRSTAPLCGLVCWANLYNWNALNTLKQASRPTELSAHISYQCSDSFEYLKRIPSEINTLKNNFLTPKNARLKSSKPQKSFNHPCHLNYCCYLFKLNSVPRLRCILTGAVVSHFLSGFVYSG